MMDPYHQSMISPQNVYARMACDYYAHIGWPGPFDAVPIRQWWGVDLSQVILICLILLRLRFVLESLHHSSAWPEVV